MYQTATLCWNCEWTFIYRFTSNSATIKSIESDQIIYIVLMLSKGWRHWPKTQVFTATFCAQYLKRYGMGIWEGRCIGLYLMQCYISQDTYCQNDIFSWSVVYHRNSLGKRMELPQLSSCEHVFIIKLSTQR